MKRIIKGFTFVELMISILLFGIIIASTLMVLDAGSLSWRSDMALLDIQQKARQAMQGMTRELRRSDSANITIASGGGTIRFSFCNESAGANYNISYYLDNSRIIREHPTGTTIVLTGDINNLEFCCWSGGSCGTTCSSSDLAEIRIEAARTFRGRSLSLNLTEKVRLRND